jgi:mannosyl-oligosaccharide glucosidase
MKRKNIKESLINRDESPDSDKKHGARKGDLPKMMLIPIGITLGFALSWYYNSFQSAQVNTPLNVNRVVDPSSYTSQQNLDRYWGTYRSNLYFGLKTRSENPLNIGMMWFNQFNNKFQIRHGCDQGDGLSKYGWTAHDGRNFGIHDVYESSDNRFQIRNSWVKRSGGSHGGDWTVRTTVEKFSGDQSPPKFVSVIFYVAKNESGWIKNIERNKGERTVSGETNDLGSFKVKLSLGDVKKDVYSDAVTGIADISILKDVLINNQFFKRKSTNSDSLREYIALKGISSGDVDSSNFIAFQVSGLIPFEFDLIFESESASKEYESRTGVKPIELNGSEFDATLAKWNDEFQNKFERIFKLKEKKYDQNAIQAAQATVSNLLGGIGFFTGQSIVKSMYSSEPVLYWQSNLYTAVPSRSFFPRG